VGALVLAGLLSTAAVAQELPADVPAADAPVETAPLAAPAPPPIVEHDAVRALAEAVAASIEQRLRDERALGAIRVDVTAGNGIDSRKLRRAFAPRLDAQLRERGKVLPRPRAPLHASVVVSLRAGRLFAVTELEGGKLVGPTTVVVSLPWTLTALEDLGGGRREQTSNFLLRRVGQLNAGVLDVQLVDLVDDFVDELVVLSIDGVRLLVRQPSTSTWSERWHKPFPQQLLWPRQTVGWLGVDATGRVVGATSAGHAFAVDVKQARLLPLKPGEVPMAQPVSPATVASTTGTKAATQSVLWALADRGNPAVRLRRPTSLRGRVGALSSRVRDIQRYDDGRQQHWAWVDNDGHLFHKQDQKAVRVVPQPVGDRFLLGDLDSDGRVDVLVTSASGPGQGDSVSLHNLDDDGARDVLFHHSFAESGVVAHSIGDVDLDEQPDVVLVEEGRGARSVLWHLEYVP